MEEDECFLVFTKEFNNENIEVKANGKIIYSGKISTNGYTTAEVVKVKNNSNIEIRFDRISKSVKINTEQIKNYKYVYVEKKNSKIVVEFNNNTKTLEGKLKSPNQ